MKLRKYGAGELGVATLAASAVVAALVSLVLVAASLYPLIHIGGGPDTACALGVNVPPNVLASSPETYTSAGHISVLPPGLVCEYVSADGLAHGSSHPSWAPMILMLAALLALIAALILAARTRHTSRL